MPAARRRTEITAPPERWQLLGRLLEDRRKELGYTYRSRRSGPSFEADSGVNKRMAADFEKAAKDRINHFMPGTLHIIALGYRVTEKSVRAVLRGEADHLTAAAPAPGPLPAAPMDDAGRTAADRPYADRIWADLRAWAAKGVTSPSGAQLFGPGQDAEAWDGTAGRMDDGDRVWHIADLQRREDGRDGGGRSAASA